MKLAFIACLCLLCVAACDDHDDVCEGACECSGLDCACPDSGDCYIDCISDCALSCTGSGNCDFECGPGCDVACQGSGDCIVDVGDDGTVSCPGSGGCDVLCEGDCSVSCPGQGVCVARCAPGFACDLTDCSGNTMSCPDDIIVCGGGCPG